MMVTTYYNKLQTCVQNSLQFITKLTPLKVSHCKVAAEDRYGTWLAKANLHVPSQSSIAKINMRSSLNPSVLLGSYRAKGRVDMALLSMLIVSEVLFIFMRYVAHIVLTANGEGTPHSSGLPSLTFSKM